MNDPMLPVPKLLAGWLVPCPRCRGTGIDDRDGLGCVPCRARGYVLNADGEKAFRFLYGFMKDELDSDGFVPEDP